MKLSRYQLRYLIESFISGPRGTMAVPDTDPSLEIADLSDEQLKKMRKLAASSPQQYDSLADAFGAIEDSDAEMYDLSPSDAYSIYKDPEGEYDERSKPENLFNSLIANYKAQAPDMHVVSQPDAVSGQGIIKNFIYSKDKSVLRKLLQNFEDKPETFEVNKDPADSSRGFIDNIYVKLANHPRFANNPAIQQFLGKYVIIVRYNKFK
jgi:hypothetical protein